MLKIRVLWFLLFSVLVAINSFGQNHPKSASDSLKKHAVEKKQKADTIQPEDTAKVQVKQQKALKRLQRFSDSVARRYRGSDTIVTHQLSRLEEYSKKMNQIQNALRRGFDTTGMSKKLDKAEEQVQIAEKGIYHSSGRLNLRNLYTSKVLLIAVGNQLDDWQSVTSEASERLIQYKVFRETVKRDPLLFQIPADNLLRAEYLRQMQDFVLRYKTVDADINKAIIRIGILQGRVVRLNMDVVDQLDEINYQIRNFKKIIFSKEAPYLWEPTSMQSKTLIKVMGFSIEKNKLIADYYLESNLSSHFFILLLIILMIFITIRAFKQIEPTVLTKISRQVRHVYRHQVASAIFIIIVPAQFFYSDSPLIYLESLWLLMVLIGSFIFWEDAQPRFKAIWPAILILFLLAVLDNLLLEVSRQERWGLFVTGCAGLALSIYMLRIGDKLKTEYKALIWVFFIQLLIGVIANPLGRYSLAKLMVDGSFFNLVAGICIVWWIRLISEFLFVQTEANKTNEKITAYINFDHLQKVIRPMLGVLGLIGWLLVFAKNLDVYDLVIEDITHFLSKERKIGTIDFTLGSVLIFFVIIWIASIISSIVSYMLGASQGQKIRKSRFGSIGLILRLTILALGFLVAIAAAGIPLDKVTIIIGALGVGIGFGLQNIVNNLVSGVILAFEKPISIGDQIEVGPNTGTVKEIGIRSSKMVTFDGAEIVIPNGDMLNQHLINWTLSNNNRRVEILVGVKYGSDLEEVKEILSDILKDRKEILAYPSPLVLVTNFGDSSINFRILFWTSDFGSWTLLKSEVIIAIDKAFKEHNIEIPFPQQDVYIKNLPEKKVEKDLKDEEKYR